MNVLPPTQQAEQPHASERPVHVTTWIALAAACLAAILAFDGDNSSILTASGPLSAAVLVAIVGCILAIIGMVKGRPAWAWVALIISLAAFALSVSDIILIQHKLDEIRNSFNDLTDGS